MSSHKLAGDIAGTIQFSKFLTPPSPMSAVFLKLSIGNFDPFPLPIANVVYGRFPISWLEMNIQKIICQKNNHSNFHNKDFQNYLPKYLYLKDLHRSNFYPLLITIYLLTYVWYFFFFGGEGGPEALTFKINTTFEGKIVKISGAKKSSVSL